MYTLKDTIPTGDLINSWRIVRDLGKTNLNGKLNYYVLVECKCGVTKTILKQNLIRQISKSCGNCDRTGPLTHGMSNTPTYAAWKSMRKSKHTIDAAWIDDFDAFLGDMGIRPDNTTLAMHKLSDGYVRGNCFWKHPEVTKLIPDVFVRKSDGVLFEIIGKCTYLANSKDKPAFLLRQIKSVDYPSVIEKTRLPLLFYKLSTILRSSYKFYGDFEFVVCTNGVSRLRSLEGLYAVTGIDDKCNVTLLPAFLSDIEDETITIPAAILMRLRVEGKI